MKKVFLTLGLIGAVAVANAQIAKGTIAVGGNLGFSVSGGSTKSGSPATTVDAASTTTFKIMPQAAYYLSDKLAIGLGIGYDMSSSGPDTANFKSSTFTIAPMVRWNMPITDKFGMFLHGSVGMGFGSSTSKFGTVSTDGPKTTAIDIAVKPGFLYFLKDNLAIEATYGRLGYNMTSEVTAATTTPAVAEKTVSTNKFDLSLDTSTLSFGFMWYFGGK